MISDDEMLEWTREAFADDLENCVAAGTATQADYLNALSGATQARLTEAQLATARRMTVLKALFAAGAPLDF